MYYRSAKGLPTPNVSVNASVTHCIGIHCGAREWGGDRFPSVTMYANNSDNANVDADARCVYNLTDPVLNTGLVQNVIPIKQDLH